LENCPEFLNEELESPFVDYLKKTWTSRRAKAAKKLTGYVSEHDLELPKFSFLSLKEIRRLANADPRRGCREDSFDFASSPCHGFIN
jgi:hypothetical protein